VFDISSALISCLETGYIPFMENKENLEKAMGPVLNKVSVGVSVNIMYERGQHRF